MINIDAKTAAVVVGGVLIIYFTTRGDVKSGVATITEKAGQTVDYISSGSLGGALYDKTHDKDGNPTAWGKFFDWLAGV